MGEIDDKIIREDMLNLLADALKKLSEKERAVIIFRYYDNMTLKDISERMNMSYSYTKIIHAKAIDRLKELIEIEDFL